MPGARIRVYGLREFRQRIVRASGEKPRFMKSGLNVVGQVIVDEALQEFPGQLADPSRTTGALERSVRALSTSTEGRVVEGTPSRVPYAGWWEFGGPSYPSRRPPNRTYMKEGRVLYPSFYKVQDKIQETMEWVLNEIAKVLDS